MPPDPPRTLAPAARAKNAFGILFSPHPDRKNAARSLTSNQLRHNRNFTDMHMAERLRKSCGTRN